MAKKNNVASNKIITILGFVLAGLLLCSYVFILVISLDNSKTSDSYRLFYVTKELRFFSRQRDFEKFAEGQYINYSATGDIRNQCEGWGSTDENGSWFLGNTCSFYIYSNSSTAHVLELDITYQLDYSNRLIVNDVEVGPLVINDGKALIDIPEGVLVDGINKFVIKTDDTVVPAPDGNLNNMNIGGMILTSK